MYASYQAIVGLASVDAAHGCRQIQTHCIQRVLVFRDVDPVDRRGPIETAVVGNLAAT